MGKEGRLERLGICFSEKKGAVCRAGPEGRVRLFSVTGHDYRGSAY